MGRTVSPDSTDLINVGSTGLAGFNFLFGTWAAWVVIAAYRGTGFGVVWNTNQGGGAHTEMETNPGTLFDWFDGTNDRTATGPTAGERALVVMTKATGTATGRLHRYDQATNVWTHANLSGTSVNSAANTSMTFGNINSSGGGASGGYDGEIFQMGMWPSVLMSDGECERLARVHDWRRLGADFFERWDRGRERRDMMNTLGRFRSRQTSRSGAGAATAAAPFGMMTNAAARRR